MRRAGCGWSDRPDDAVPHADRERAVAGALIQEAPPLLHNESFDLDLIGFDVTELERLLAWPTARVHTDRLGEEPDARRELDPKDVDTIILRWQAFSGGTAVLDGDGRSYEEIAAGREAAAA
jgi:hypothetical protein